MIHRHLAIAIHFLALIPCLVPCLACYGQKQPPTTGAQLWGYKGPVHTVKAHDEVLNPDPCPGRRAPATADTRWQLFNPAGDELERGKLDKEDSPVKIERFELNRARKMFVASGDDGRRREEDFGTPGLTEFRYFRDAQIMLRTVFSSDEQGRMIESKTFASGGLQVHRKYRYGNRVAESWLWWGDNDRFGEHRLSKFDEDGDLAEQIDYDAKGEPVVIFRLSKDQLTYYWRNPACECASSVEADFRSEGKTTSYLVDLSGNFEKRIEHYRDHWQGFRVDEEAYDASGKLIDRVAYEYENDAHGNWTTRVTKVRDPNTGDMVLITREVRTFTYFADH